MKKSDIVLFIVVGIFSTVFGLLFSKLLIGSPETRGIKVETAQSITNEFNEPDEKYFNEKSINPTNVIDIEENDNNHPFSSD